MSELHAAIEQKDVKKVKHIVGKKKKEALAQLLCTFDGDQQTPLIIALKNNHAEMVDIILSAYKATKADINSKDKNGYTALHHAAICCQDTVLMQLLSYPDLNVNVENADKNRPLHYFCQSFASPNCHDPFVALRYKGAEVNVRNSAGEAPLHKAVFNNSSRIMMITVLLKEGKADVNIRNERGETPLHYAVRLGRGDLVAALLIGGADFSLAGSVGDKKTPLELAEVQGQKDIFQTIKKFKDLKDWLKSIGMDQYYQAFVSHEIFMDEVANIDESDLARMNVAAGDHQTRIVKAAKLLGDKSQSNRSSGLRKTIIGLTPDDIAELFSSESRDITGLREKLKAMQPANAELNLININEIEFTKNINSGASGTVYKGLYKKQEVAIKVLKTTPGATEVEEFRKEFEIMSAIRSPYIVRFFGAVLEPKLCMVMEFCSKGSLFHVLSDEMEDIGWDQFFHFAIQMVEGTAALHSSDPPIVHRDIKSLNLLVNDQWDIKVCDFGLSRFDTTSNMETLQQLRGTGSYLAPELMMGESFSVKSDVYSLGIILWELTTRTITGRYQRPFGEYDYLKRDYQIMMQAATQGLRPTIPPSTPPPLLGLLKRCFDKEPAVRPNCPELITILQTLVTDWKNNPMDWEKCRNRSQ